MVCQQGRWAQQAPHSHGESTRANQPSTWTPPQWGPTRRGVYSTPSCQDSSSQGWDCISELDYFVFLGDWSLSCCELPTLCRLQDEWKHCATGTRGPPPQQTPAL